MLPRGGVAVSLRLCSLGFVLVSAVVCTHGFSDVCDRFLSLRLEFFAAWLRSVGIIAGFSWHHSTCCVHVRLRVRTAWSIFGGAERGSIRIIHVCGRLRKIRFVVVPSCISPFGQLGGCLWNLPHWLWRTSSLDVGLGVHAFRLVHCIAELRSLWFLVVRSRLRSISVLSGFKICVSIGSIDLAFRPHAIGFVDVTHGLCVHWRLPGTTKLLTSWRVRFGS
mmetsp:Transcript_134047/g.428265  ORF Transcript_134047/g.428265 Transcript_134047/m.428265 type:complete len:221 (+) Transcript_134047:2109-2771(+)